MTHTKWTIEPITKEQKGRSQYMALVGHIITAAGVVSNHAAT